ncbi:Flp pilus assembly protein CpaB [Brevibacillus migulae]|uniref:Flp pilus assembly protein CpaB n=1 Tax=Brevibacillus migulae TaxID=1644114 RepID=UPI00106DE06B|nr:Flp pilus assembly protein CpaB [Brevibacillus migulae]
MKKRGSLLIISILCALATTYLIYLTLQQKVKEESPADATQTIVVAATKIPPYTKITPSMVKTMEVAKNMVHTDMVTDPNQAIGMVSLETMIPEQMILTPFLAKPEASNLFAMQVPEGLRAMSVSYSQVKGAGGHIFPGDRVDVLVAYTKDALKSPADIVKISEQNLLVLAVGQDREKPIEESVDEAKPGEQPQQPVEGEQQSRSTITLAVTPQQAESLGFAESFGEVRLLLRAPQDKKRVQTPGVQTHTVLTR